MIKQSVFLLLGMIPSAAFCGIGTIDKREYVTWDTGIYKNYVKICSGSGCGTGQFITSKHILTNKHVAECCGIDKEYECEVYLSDGDYKFAKVIDTGGGLDLCKYNRNRDIGYGLDWSIIEITEPGFHHSYFDFQSSKTGSGFSRAGFGGLKVLTNDDIRNIKIAYEKWLKKVYPRNTRKRNKVASYGADLELGNYSFYDGRDIDGYKSTITYQTFFDEFGKLTDKDFYKDYLNDSNNLKVIKNCRITESTHRSINHTCEGWHGDSGSAILDSSNVITGLHNRGLSYAGATFIAGVHNRGVPIHSDLYDAIDRVKKSQTPKKSKPNKPSAPASPGPTPNNPSTPSGERKIGGECLVPDLPPHATAGHYIKSGLKKYDCGTDGVCSCAATQCESGYYLVVNASGNSQGWCYTRRCPSGKHLNIIGETKTDTKCVDDLD